jgi:hypothetical protein
MAAMGDEPLFDSRGWIRPGPASIEPGQHPDGVVIHVYTATEPPVLVTVHKLRFSDDVESTAEADAAAFDAFTADAACLVAYDGDTGERFPAEAWHA